MPAIAYPAVRGLILITLLALVGTVTTGRLMARAGLPPESPASNVIDGWLRRLPGLLGWFLLMLSLVRGGLQVLAFTDPGMPVDPELAMAVLTTGPWGAGWMMQTSAAFILLALSWLLRREVRRMHLMVAAATGVILISQTGMGHGMEPLWSPAILGRVTVATHLLGAGLWIGTLLVLAIAVVPSLGGKAERPVLANVIRQFSIFARAGAVLVVASGVVATLTYIGSLSDLWSSTWGWLLLAKLAAFVAIAAIGWFNWRVITPRLLAAEAPAVRTLRIAVAIEVTLAVLLLAVTAVLVATELP